jgi:hypothetical protein
MDDAKILSQKFTYLTYDQALTKLNVGKSLEECMKIEYKNIYISKLLKKTTYTSYQASDMLLLYSYEWCMRIFLYGDYPVKFNIYQHILKHSPFLPPGSHIKNIVLTRSLRKFIHKTNLSEKDSNDILQLLSFNKARRLFNTSEECNVLYNDAKHFMSHTNCSLEQSIEMIKNPLFLSKVNTSHILQLPIEEASNLFNNCNSVDDCVSMCRNAKVLMRQTDYSFIKSIVMLKDNTVEECISFYLDVPIKEEKQLSTNQGIFKVMRELY